MLAQRLVVAVPLLLVGVLLAGYSQRAGNAADKPKDAKPSAKPTTSEEKAPNAAADWPTSGRDATRNPVTPAKNLPTDWDVGEFERKTGRWISDKARNIKWVARLGSATFASPVIADGHVYIGTNNGAGYLERYPSTVDLGCLLCFRESDGEFLWQYSAEKLPTGRVHDWELRGIGSSPLVEGDRMWFVSNRWEVVCLDTQGFRDRENDGPYVEEAIEGQNEADVIWRFDLINKLGVSPHPAAMGPCRRCSIAPSYNNRIYVVTGNGVSYDHSAIPAPEAPSLVCFDKDTGQVLWTDASPGKNILHTQVADPLVADINGRTQVIVPQGDGWIRSFDALTGKLIWKFDANHKETRWTMGLRHTRNNILATPVLYQGLIYIGVGQEAEHGDGSGRLVCIDPTKTDDISSELAVDAEGHPLPHRRLQAVISEQGEKAIPNPNSGLVWEYTRFDHDGDGKIEFEEEFHRTISSVAIKDDILYAADFSGLFHCLNAKTGKVYWTYDMLSSWGGSPLLVDGHVYIGDEDGDVSIFRHSADPKIAMKEIKLKNGSTESHPINAYLDEKGELVEVTYMGNSVYTTPIVANNVLYIASRSRLFAIATQVTQRNETSARDSKSDSATEAQQLRNSERRLTPSNNADRVPKPIFVPTPRDVVEKMLEVAKVGRNDTVVDLGSGDGRIVIAAAKKYRAKAIGYEIDDELVETSREKAKDVGVAALVDIKRQDMYTADLSEANVVTVFLYPVVLEKLKPQFAKMKPGSWIVSHHYEIPGAQPEQVFTVKSKETGNEHRVLLYKTPLSDDD